MELYSSNKDYKLYHGNMLDMLDVIEPNTIDSVITDPPYGLTSITKRFGKEGSAECQYGKDGSFARLSKGFMGKEWDGSGIEYNVDAWRKCYEVLKPGGYLLAFGGSRTFHRIACAIEDAGFEIRDTIMWLYGSEFPKSMNIGIAIDKKNGVESEVVGSRKEHDIRNNNFANNEVSTKTFMREIKKASNEWSGWGTALKPSFEPIIVARKPFKDSLVDNVIEYGVGGINIDECRVETNDNVMIKKGVSGFAKNYISGEYSFTNIGRFPANTILTYDETDFDEVCGGFPYTKSTPRTLTKGGTGGIGQATNFQRGSETSYFNDSGSASRYFMNCKYTGKDEEIWKQLLVNNVGNNLEILKATKDNIAQMSVRTLLKELKDHYAKYVDNQLDLTETPIVQDIVEMLTWDFKIETSQVIQDFITNSKKCIQLQNLVQFVEKMDSIDTTQITQNLLKLFGYVKVVITNYIQGNIEYDQKRYIYTPKASKKDRDEGLDNFDVKGAKELLNREENSDGASWNGKYSSGNAYAGSGAPKKNTHPTVKPCELCQYLIRLVSPNGATILDPFNGSGSTGKAVMYENKERNKNYKYIGIELTEEYLPISKARIECLIDSKEEIKQDTPTGQTNIFDYIKE